jgi:arylsulfatase A-like enzyme
MIPFVVSGPGIPEKTIPFARLVDLMPTAGKLMGFDTPGVEGRSIL